MEKKTIINILLTILISCLLISAAIYIDAYLTSSDIKQDNFGITFPEPSTLLNGSAFYVKIPSTATRIEFVAMPQTYGLADRTLPADAIDMSEAQDGSIMAWMEDTTFYVVSMNGKKILANPDSRTMFYNRSKLTYINTENLDTSTVINASQMFYGCSNLTNTIDDFDLSNVNNLYHTFFNCTWLTEFTIPYNITTIDDCAFFGTGLTSITIPASVETIKAGAFCSCENLSSVTFEEGSQLKSIGSEAFVSCNLTTINLPASVSTLNLDNGSPFKYNSRLATINVDPANENYVSIDGVLYTKDMKTLVQYPIGKTDKTCSIPIGTEVVNDCAFAYCNNITSITFPEGLIKVGERAFYGCTNLEDIEFSSTITTFGSFAFSSTRWQLYKFELGEMVIVNNVIIESSGISGDVVIPEGIKEIPEYFVSNNSKVTSVYIPSSIEVINKSAFNYCSNLTTITFAENSQLKTIGENAFTGCKNLTSINLPNSITTIQSYAFENCTALTSISIPAGITKLNSYTFRGCTNLTTVVIPYNITSINSNCFRNCSSLTTINYTGTEEQWNAITFGTNWNNGVHADFQVVFNYVPEN